MTLNDAIQKAAEQLSAAGITTARLDSEVLLAHILDTNRAWLFTHIHDDLNHESEQQFREAVGRRAERQPLQYIIGMQEFWGLNFLVTPDVLIPRPESEFLVESATNILKRTDRPTVIDLCTGSGCIAVSIAKTVQSSRIFATDLSDRALAVSRQNARKHGVMDRIRFLEGDLFGPLEELDLHGKVDVVLANPPYIRSIDLPALQPEVKDNEPRMALIAGTTGTEVHAKIIQRAPAFLKKQGALIMEMGIGQAETLTRMVGATGVFGRPDIMKDLAGIERVIIARKQ